MKVTEVKTVKLDASCKEYPVFVSWLSTLGREYWLFHKVQTEGLITQNLGDFEPYTDDIENSRGQINDISIFAQPQLVCYGSIDSEDLQGLKSILYSVNIEVLTNPLTWETDGVKWETYRVLTGSFKIINTDEVRAEFEVTFNKNYINNISQ